MPRPTIMRNVYGLPPYKRFGPLGNRVDLDIIIMSIEEYETIRLIDELNYSQAECAKEMGIGRTTAQRIYNSARKKIALCLVYGKILKLDGGIYSIKGHNRGRGQGRPYRQGMGRNRQENNM